MLALVFPRDGRTERHLLATGDTTVGRSPVCDLVINDPSISRRHARFRVHGDHCLLTDLGGRNGTYLNGELVAEAEVNQGDAVMLGRFQLHLEKVGDHAVLGRHEPSLSTPSTLCRRIDELEGPTPVWRATADSGRLLNVIATVATRLVRAQPGGAVLDQVAAAVFDLVPVERVFVLQPQADRPGLVPTLARARNGGPADPSTVSSAIVERAFHDRLVILSTDLVPESHTPTMAGLEPPVRWFMCVPLCDAGAAVGVVYADRAGHPLGPADLDVLAALSLCAGAALGGHNVTP
jgi:pSer/pThr/pTyr-binding forkhead associated (FHA) protein